MLRSIVSIVCLVLLSPTLASAQIVNGDFENGLTGWNVAPEPPDWLIGTGDNLPCHPGAEAFISTQEEFTGPAIGCISQQFVCGSNPEGVCEITIDYSLITIAPQEPSHRFFVKIDGVEKFSTSTYASCTSTGPISVPCGTHTIELCLERNVSTGFGDLLLDNVVATCDVGSQTRTSSWGRLKALHR